MNQNLVTNIIKKQLSEQEKLLSDTKSQIDKLSAECIVIQNTINSYKAQLDTPSYNSSSQSTDTNLDNAVIDHPQFCMQHSLHILKKSQNTNGLLVNDIVREYEKIGIKANSKFVVKHVSSLLDDGIIYQTNPEVQRGRRYKVKEEN